MTMEENKKNLAEGDWELSEEYYHQDSSEKTLNLEDFIEAEEPDGSEEETFGKDDELGVELSRVAEQVRQTMEFTAQGMSAEEIAERLGVEASYVRDIAVCVQAFPEDNPMAVARLLVLG
jgi:ribosome-binding protein aMBF1 (putative translation factor)